MHVEALAWFDRHLKGRDTGIDDGPPVRFWLPGDDEWRAAERGRRRRPITSSASARTVRSPPTREMARASTCASAPA